MPGVPLLRGLPEVVRSNVFGPLFRLRVLQSIGNALTNPLLAWLAMNLAYLGWHVPSAYELALHSDGWHEVEHACFFFTSLMFWFPVIQPWPSKTRWSRWTLLPYLLSADIVNTGLSAFLTFCGKLLYPSYGTAPRISSLSPLGDQTAAGAFMWVIGSLAFLTPAAWITAKLLSASSKLAVPHGERDQDQPRWARRAGSLS
jgi:cytochrome c oxidase assembly factor CtaG